MKYCYVIYSHTDYLDILIIATHYLDSCSNKKLIINKSDKDLSSIYKQYNEVIFYDDSLPYASRLLELQSLSMEYILLIHEIDIVIKQDMIVIERLVKEMIDNNIDRIDLKYAKSANNNEYINLYNNGYSFFLTKQSSKDDCLYNVNPSIWKLSSLLETLNKFPNKTYRTIEQGDVFIFCDKFNIYKMYNEKYLECGYFRCLPFFQYLHISHSGGLLPLFNNNLEEDINKEYHSIYETFLSKGQRRVRKILHDG